MDFSSEHILKSKERSLMPRLEGMKSNAGIHVAMVIVLAIVVLWFLEYYGVINLINGFGAREFPRWR